MSANKILLFLILIVVSMPSIVSANNKVNVYVITNDNCSWCQKQDEYIKNNYSQDKNVNFYKIDAEDEQNTDLIEKILHEFKIGDTWGVPLMFIGSEILSGYSEESLDEHIQYAKENEYVDKIGNIVMQYNNDLSALKEDYNGEYEKAGEVSTNRKIYVYIIEQDHCKNCDMLDDYIKNNYNNDENVSFFRLNISRGKPQELSQLIYDKTGIEVYGTPVMIIGNKILYGYQEKGLDEAIEDEKMNPSEYNYNAEFDEIRKYLYGDGVNASEGASLPNNSNTNSSSVDKLKIIIILGIIAILILFFIFGNTKIKNIKQIKSTQRSNRSKKLKVIILVISVMAISGCASNVEENIVGHIYTGCDILECYTYIFNENHLGIKDNDQEFTYVIDGDEVTLYSDRWSNSPVRYKYNSKTKCLERLGNTRIICKNND